MAAEKVRDPADAYLRGVALLRFEANRLIASVLPSTSPSASEKATLPENKAVSLQN